MFKKPVVFVVGAGASVDYEMPLGAGLASKIAEACKFEFNHYSNVPSKGDQDLFRLLYQRYGNDRAMLDRYTIAGARLAGSIASAISVDDALYQLSDYPEAVHLGKACIFRFILQAEQRSTLKIIPEKGQPPEDAGRKDWMEHVFSMASRE
jgi:hypothetical protein